MSETAKTPLDHMSERTRRWLVTFCALVLASFLTQIGLGGVQLWSIFGNRDVGNGNRTVSCATLERVAPDLYRSLPECAGQPPLPTPTPGGAR